MQITQIAAAPQCHLYPRCIMKKNCFDCLLESGNVGISSFWRDKLPADQICFWTSIPLASHKGKEGRA